MDICFYVRTYLQVYVGKVIGFDASKISPYQVVFHSGTTDYLTEEELSEEEKADDYLDNGFVIDVGYYDPVGLRPRQAKEATLWFDTLECYQRWWKDHAKAVVAADAAEITSFVDYWGDTFVEPALREKLHLLQEDDEQLKTQFGSGFGCDNFISYKTGAYQIMY
jgi:hypothetical protein